MRRLEGLPLRLSGVGDHGAGASAELRR